MRKRFQYFASKRGVDGTDTQVMEYDMSEFIEIAKSKSGRSLTAKKINEFADFNKKPQLRSVQCLDKDSLSRCLDMVI